MEKLLLLIDSLKKAELTNIIWIYEFLQKMRNMNFSHT